MIEPSVKAEILRRLKAAEQEHDMRILYACESGSRAWGFASPDSDYDVRFIYVRNEDWYLSFDVENKRDVIEYPIVDEIDCSGWDLRKALYLLTRTNGALLEWLNSPICYIEQTDVPAKLRALAPRAFNDIALCYHYSHMARGNAREYLFRPQVRLKKYFYVLRPLFAIRYIQKHRLPPPVEFEVLLDDVCPSELRPVIDELIDRKKYTPEVGEGDAIVALNEFIEQELAAHGSAFAGQGRPELADSIETRAQLNTIFREGVRAK